MCFSGIKALLALKLLCLHCSNYSTAMLIFIMLSYIPFSSVCCSQKVTLFSLFSYFFFTIIIIFLPITHNLSPSNPLSNLSHVTNYMSSTYIKTKNSKSKRIFPQHLYVLLCYFSSINGIMMHIILVNRPI